MEEPRLLPLRCCMLFRVMENEEGEENFFTDGKEINQRGNVKMSEVRECLEAQTRKARPATHVQPLRAAMKRTKQASCRGREFLLNCDGKRPHTSWSPFPVITTAYCTRRISRRAKRRSLCAVLTKTRLGIMRGECVHTSLS